MNLKFTPVSNSNEHCIITNYQPLPENATSFPLDSQLSSTGHSPINNLFYVTGLPSIHWQLLLILMGPWE